MKKAIVTCLDLEGVLTPEIWIEVAERMGIAQLNITTRDIPDYDKLMRQRLEILTDHKVKFSDIMNVIRDLRPLDGAKDFLGWLRERCQVIILSDTFYELVGPFMRQLEYPSVFCHTLEIDGDGFIRNYFLRQTDQKSHAVVALKSLNFQVLAAGDSYNDVSMLKEAHAGVFFRPPETISLEFPQFPVTHSYAQLQEELCRAGGLQL